MQPSFIVFELAMYVIACLVLGYCWRHQRLLFWVACTGMVYSAGIEFADMYFDDAYYYGDFLVMLGPRQWAVPLQVAVAWGVIIALVMLLSARLPLPWQWLAFVDAFLAVCIDLTLDPVVSNGIRMDAVFETCFGVDAPAAGFGLGFWVWCVNPGEQHFWQGVPLENFMGWFVLVATFSFAVRYARLRHGLDEARGLRLVARLAAVCVLGALAAEGIIYGILQLEYVGVSSWVTTGALMAIGALGVLAPGLRRTTAPKVPLIFLLPVFDLIYCWYVMIFGVMYPTPPPEFLMAMGASTALLLGAFLLAYLPSAARFPESVP